MIEDEKNMQRQHEHGYDHAAEGHQTCGHGHETCGHDHAAGGRQTCGHDHAGGGHHVHEHHHDEACQCPSCTQKKEKLKVTSLLQDNAVVVSAEYRTAADRGRAGKLLTEYMEALAGEIDSRGGIIGHIKISVEIRYVEMYSLTDRTVMKKESHLPELILYMAAIVFAVKEEELLSLVRDMFGDMDRQLHEN